MERTEACGVYGISRNKNGVLHFFTMGDVLYKDEAGGCMDCTLLGPGRDQNSMFSAILAHSSSLMFP